MYRFATYSRTSLGQKSSKPGVLITVLAGLLAACGNSGNNTGPGASVVNSSGPPPVSLVKSFNAQNSTIRKVALNSGSVAKAVERYRINKKIEPSPYKKAGVDLNGDGEAEALVYLTGEKWCAPTGCTLVIFRNGQFGYRAISTIRRVKTPIRVGASESQGWHDLFVQTGGVSGLPEQTVPLKFTGRGYPGNATTIAPVEAGIPVEGVIVFEHEIIPAQPEYLSPTSTGAPLSSGISSNPQPIALHPRP